jgi:hypothetical protein
MEAKRNLLLSQVNIGVNSGSCIAATEAALLLLPQGKVLLFVLVRVPECPEICGQGVGHLFKARCHLVEFEAASSSQRKRNNFPQLPIPCHHRPCLFQCGLVKYSDSFAIAQTPR